MAPASDTIAALATPAGTSALAVVRVSGPDTVRLGRGIFGDLSPPRSLRRADYRDCADALVDTVLVAHFAGPKSYTGEDLIEITCHGNPFIVRRILDDLFARGCRPAGPGEFTQRAFLNGKMDLSQAEAVGELIHAQGERALAAAHLILGGALGRHLRPLTERLIGLAAQVEARIDFPDEDLPEEDRLEVRSAIDVILRETSQLLATQRYGQQLREGFRTVIVGEPNAGKSSLLNRLLGRDRAIVSPEPGTTRDFIEETAIVGPHFLRLTDTAGLNPSPGAVERLGIEKTLGQIAGADLIVLVLDATRPAPPIAEPLASRMGPGNSVVALNKADLLDGPISAQGPEGLQSVLISALTGTGMGELTSTLSDLADGFQQVAGDEGIAINARHADALGRAKASLGDALLKMDSGGAFDELLASDLRGALDAFGDISGRIDNERMLDVLFSTFCIGK